MDSQPKEYYVIEKSKMDMLIEFLSNTYKMCNDLTKVHDDIVEMLRKSLVYEMEKLNDVIVKNIESSNQ
jgi:hypothetical protein